MENIARAKLGNLADFEIRKNCQNLVEVPGLVIYFAVGGVILHGTLL